MSSNLGPNPLVSVVIPNFNYGRFLEDCISSILNQTYANIEVILVDDGSTDNSLEIASQYSNSVQILTQSNQGVNAARNLGIAKSRGDLIALCDSDDYWEPHKLEMQINKFHEDFSTGLVYCDILTINLEGKKTAHKRALHSGDISLKFIEKPTQALIVNGPSTAVFKRDLVHPKLLFDPILRGNGEDWDFFRRLSQLTAVKYVAEPLVIVREHGQNRSARSLDYFYAGNSKAISKALADTFYEWNYRKIWSLIFRFEILCFKSNLKEFQISASFTHLRRALLPFLALRHYKFIN
jgi:glycosyltransferase involved in cell wall biosynthesis